MANLFHISEAVTIAMHGMALIASSEGRLNAVNLSTMTGYSRSHIAKVLGILVKTGFLISDRGPSGGFALQRPASGISLMDVFEAIEGRLLDSPCDLPCKLCAEKGCLLGGFSARFTKEFSDYLRSRRFSDFQMEFQNSMFIR